MSILKNDNFFLSIPLNRNGACNINFSAGFLLDSRSNWFLRMVDLHLPKVANFFSKEEEESKISKETRTTGALCYIRNTSNLMRSSYINGRQDNILDLLYLKFDETFSGLMKQSSLHQVTSFVISQISFEFVDASFNKIEFVSSIGEIKISFEKQSITFQGIMDPGFYVYLPSNVLDHTGRNTPQSYKTFLHPIVNLSKEYTWDVGVSSFFYVNSMTNITEIQYFDVKFYNPSGNKLASMRCSLKAGDYTTGEKLTEALIEVFKGIKHPGKIDLSDIIDVTYSPVSRKIFFYNKKNSKAKDLASISIIFLTEELSSLLGIEARKNHILPVHTKYSLDFHPNFHAIYLYSDISAFQNIGGIQAPILATFGVKGQSGELICERPQNITYARVLNHDINSVHISLNTETGEPVPFEGGFTQVVLHFRPRF